MGLGWGWGGSSIDHAAKFAVHRMSVCRAILERERERGGGTSDFRLQMVYCILAIGPYTNRNTKQNYAHT